MRMPWRLVLIEIPALIVTLWFAAYRIFLLVVTMVVVTAVLLTLGGALLGYRWGW